MCRAKCYPVLCSRARNHPVPPASLPLQLVACTLLVYTSVYFVFITWPTAVQDSSCPVKKERRWAMILRESLGGSRATQCHCIMFSLQCHRPIIKSNSILLGARVWETRRSCEQHDKRGDPKVWKTGEGRLPQVYY